MGLSRRDSGCTLVIVALSAILASRAASQTVQATAYQRARTTTDHDSLLAQLSADVGRFGLIADEAAGEHQKDPLLAKAVARAADAARAAMTDPARFTVMWTQYQGALDEWYGGCDPKLFKVACERPLRMAAASAPPQVFDIVPSVFFTAGYGFSAASHMRPQHVVGLSTNLLGAAAGGVVSAIGIKPLEEYLRNNVAVGTEFPTDRNGRLSGFVQLGLGQVSVGRITMWPVLTMEQLDSADARIPDSLAILKPGMANWSAPSISVGLTWWTSTEIRDRLVAGKLTPIVTFGLTFPDYFPGDPFESLAGLITNKRGEYQKAGGARFSVGIGIPLIRAGKPSAR